MRMSAAKFQHRILIQSQTLTQSGTSGDMVPTYSTFADRVPAAWEPVSVTDFVASNSNNSQIVARCIIRYMPGLLPNMRIQFDGVYYDPQGFLTDKDTGRDYITIPVKQALSQTP